jgi:hypothetical protein
MICPSHQPLAEEMAELKARQQQQANHIFKVQQRQMEPAYIQHLETYIVSGMQG